MKNTLSSTRGRLGLITSVVALLALVGVACQPVQPPGVDPWNPTGVLDSVVGAKGEVRVTGWASQWDLHVGPNAEMRDMGPVQIVVMVNGQWVKGTFPASKSRPDVDAAMIGISWNLRQANMGYGFDFTVPALRGEATVCVAALNQNLDVTGPLGIPGDHVLLGCRKVTVR